MLPRKFPARKIILASLLCLAGLWWANGQEPTKPQQQPEDVVRVYTDLVQTDVMVFDKEGRFVNGLKRYDFQLRIDGKPQPIEFFDRIATGSGNEERQLAAARGASTKESAPAPLDRGRAIFFYVDDFHLASGDLVFVRKALSKFIDDTLGQNDEAVITSASGQIGFLQQLTDNKAVLRAAIERIKARPNLIHDPEQPPMNEYQALIIDRSPAAMGPSGRNYHDLTDFFVGKQMQKTQGSSGGGSSSSLSGAGNSSSSGGNGSEALEVAELMVRNRARVILEQATPITTSTLTSFENLVKSSTQLPGRKLVFFISGGFFLDRRNSDAVHRLEQITYASARNGVVIYSLDARGLTTNFPKAGDEVAIDPSGTLDREAVNELSASREGMTTLALDTGGRTIFDTNALDVGLAKAVKETSVYYLLAWRRNHEDTAESARKPRTVEVTVQGRPELTVRLRQGGIFDVDSSGKSPQTNKDERRAEATPATKLDEAIKGTYPSSELPIALSLSYVNTPDKGAILTESIELMSDSLSFIPEAEKEKAVVDLAGSVYNADGKLGAHFNQQKIIATTLANSARPPDQPLIFKQQVALPPGLYQVRAGARDDKSGKAGTVHQWIEIPDLSAHRLALSSVIAGEPPTAAAQNEQNQSTRISVRPDHRFHRGSPLRFLVYIYNATVSPADSKADLVMQAQVLRDRQPVITTPLKDISTEDIHDANQISAGGDLSLENLPRGRYLLLITVIDRASKTSASQEMRFEIQ